jgi:uncharacterized membrane protein YdjX (TVP38/TMEM64 family)
MTFQKIISPLGALSVFIALGTYLCIASFHPDEIRHLGMEFGVVAPLLFMALRLLTSLVAPIGGTAYFLAAEPLFGLAGGFFFLFSATFGGYCLAFAASRRDRGATQECVNPSWRQPEHGPEFWTDVYSLVQRRALMFGLQDLVSYGAGASSISFRAYSVVTCLATIAQTGVGMAIGRVLVAAHPALLVLYTIMTVAVLPRVWVSLLRTPTDPSS